MIKKKHEGGHACSIHVYNGDMTAHLNVKLSHLFVIHCKDF